MIHAFTVGAPVSQVVPVVVVVLRPQRMAVVPLYGPLLKSATPVGSTPAAFSAARAMTAPVESLELTANSVSSAAHVSPPSC